MEGTKRPKNSLRRLTPNQLVAERIAFARKLRGWTQEEAAERLAPVLGLKWSSATFSIVERSVDGKRIKQFSADELVALSRAFQLPIGFWFTPVWSEEDFPLMVTPDAPEGVSTSVLVEALLGDEQGFECWANELLDWGARTAHRTDPTTGEQTTVREPLPTAVGWVNDAARLRAEMAVALHFGDLEAAKDGLGRMMAVLEQLLTVSPPPDDGRPPTDGREGEERA